MVKYIASFIVLWFVIMSFVFNSCGSKTSQGSSKAISRAAASRMLPVFLEINRSSQ